MYISADINVLQIVIFSLFVLIWKPIIVMILLGIMGHTKKNNFLTGLSLGQIKWVFIYFDRNGSCFMSNHWSKSTNRSNNCMIDYNYKIQLLYYLWRKVLRKMQIFSGHAWYKQSKQQKNKQQKLWYHVVWIWKIRR